MNPVDFFNRGNKLLLDNPARPEDKDFIKDFDKFGIGAGLDFNPHAYGDSLEEDIKDIISKLKPSDTSRVDEYVRMMGNWKFFGEPIGQFGTAYYYRAYVALFGLGANPAHVAIYPNTMFDSEGNELDGHNKYLLHFNSFPPLKEKGFWSVTAYGEDSFLIKNPIDRYAVTDRFDFDLNEDGSLDIILSASQPSDINRWLPVSSEPFNLVLRIYHPDIDAIKDWKTPTITKLQ